MLKCNGHRAPMWMVALMLGALATSCSNSEAELDTRGPSPIEKKSVAQLKGQSEVPSPQAPSATPPASVETSRDGGAAESPGVSSSFDTLWSQAQEEAPPLAAPMAVFLKKATFCSRFTCGDQFEPYKEYAPLVEKGKETINSLWRFEVRQKVGVFSLDQANVVVGDFDLKAKTIPLLVRWPVVVDHTMYSTKKPKYEGGGLWVRALEKVHAVQFADGSEARDWAQKHQEIFVRYVFQITGGVMNPDKYGEDVLIVKVLGRQIRSRQGFINKRYEVIDEFLVE